MPRSRLADVKMLLSALKEALGDTARDVYDYGTTTVLLYLPLLGKPGPPATLTSGRLNGHLDHVVAALAEEAIGFRDALQRKPMSKQRRQVQTAMAH